MIYIGIITLSVISIFGLVVRYYPKRFFNNDKLLFRLLEIMALTGVYFILLYYTSDQDYFRSLLITILFLSFGVYKIKKILKEVE